MARCGIEENPHIVRDFYIGNTHIKIADNYCVDKEEMERIRERCSQIWAESELAKQRKQEGGL